MSSLAIPVSISFDAVAVNNFLCDIASTFVEGGTYSWFQVDSYRWFDPNLEGGTAKPAVIDGVTCQAFAGRIRVENPDAGTWKRWRPMTKELILDGFRKLAAGPVDGLTEVTRSRLVGSFVTLDASLDVNDADIVMQVAMLDSVIYA